MTTENNDDEVLTILLKKDDLSIWKTHWKWRWGWRVEEWWKHFQGVSRQLSSQERVTANLHGICNCSVLICHHRHHHHHNDDHCHHHFHHHRHYHDGNQSQNFKNWPPPYLRQSQRLLYRIDSQNWDEDDVEILPIWTFYCGIQREDLSWLRNTRCPAYCRRGTLVPYMCSGAISLFWCRTYYICSGAIPLFWCRTCVLVPYLCSGTLHVFWYHIFVLVPYICSGAIPLF